MPADINKLLAGIKTGDRIALSQAITLVESIKSGDQDLSRKLIGNLTNSNQAIRLAVSGSPGVGKSTFIDAIGFYLAEHGHRIAVLAIDPSSAQSRGSILGDKTRMSRLSRHPNAFIRPSPAGGLLGGIATSTYEASLLCEEAGYDVIIIETVGVGQSETLVRHLADLFLLLLQPAAGDDLQGIKKGILEDADLLLVNKWDSHMKQEAERTHAAYRLTWSKSRDQVKLISSLEDIGIEDVWESITFLLKETDSQLKRKEREIFWFLENTRRLMLKYFLEKNSAILDNLVDNLKARSINYSEAIENALKKICT
ncbi:MAG: methylmalonyl Co-A mutase-associated GTPase MeaB [Saprospiraceae bacterium]|nr:methylmalonyl Co-A mutase-associated GTPase MeaB [Saprospiraceae bacterium]